MLARIVLAGLAASILALVSPALSQQEQPRKYLGPLRMDVPHISTDAAVKYDFPIVYVRAPRTSPDGKSRWAEVGDPRTMEPGADLVILYPDGKEEVLVPVNEKESIADPQVSFDGQTVYYAKFHDALGHKGSDIYKVNVKTRQVVQLTSQKFTPNTGVADWSKTPLPSWGVYNLGPCPLPGGRIAFVSDRNVFKATNPGYAPNALALQLFTMDDPPFPPLAKGGDRGGLLGKDGLGDPPSPPLEKGGKNVQCIGHLNLGMALHPVMLKDGRLMFSSLESQGLRSHHLWGVWSINPDGTHWGPLMSAFEIGNGTADSLHFQTQLSNEEIVVESYYNLNNFGFGTLLKFPISPADGYAAFGPGYKPDERNAKVRHSRHADGRGIYIQFPFSPYGLDSLTPFVLKGDWPSSPSVAADRESPRVGKFTHPAAAPDNHVLTAYSAGSLNNYKRYKPAFDSGIYLIKSGQPIDEPAQMLLIKNDPKYHEQWPRALVPYKQIYGVDEPRRIEPLANDGSLSPHLPAGTPYGLVGTSSLYKRESYPYGRAAEGSVTASFAGETDRSGARGHDTSHNWSVQGADAGLYENDEIHAIRILLLEPTSETRPRGGRTYYNHARERMRILGEIPVRKFGSQRSAVSNQQEADSRKLTANSSQPLDPDGNPDTSFLAKIPADVAWTFQTLNKDGMVLNSSQTWHQLRPGEVRHDCGGCHAHSQQPTLFAETAAAKADYKIFDLTEKSPLLTTKALDESKRKWDAADESGLRYEQGVTTVEYFRDIKPIFARSCVACHTKDSDQPAGKLVLDDDTLVKARNPAGLGFDMMLPASYARLAADAKGQWGHKPLHRHGWTDLAASRYVRQMQSRRSLLIWKIFGRRLDGWQNDDFPYEQTPGDPTSLHYHGEPAADTPKNREISHVGYTGGIMPPPKAVKSGKVQPLSDEDRLTLVRWIDLGCPIDLTYDAEHPDAPPRGWGLDDQRPTLTLTYPRAGRNEKFDRILIGMHDYNTGIDAASFTVKADFEIDGAAAGENLASRFEPRGEGVWELRLKAPMAELPQGVIDVSVKDGQGNITRIERTFQIQP